MKLHHMHEMSGLESIAAKIRSADMTCPGIPRARRLVAALTSTCMYEVLMFKGTAEMNVRPHAPLFRGLLLPVISIPN